MRNVFERNRNLIAAAALVFFVPLLMQAQRDRKADQERAEQFFKKVWNAYRVPAHKGLFREHYPFQPTDQLDYFEGAPVAAKEVSFLWPFSGMFSAVNVFMQDPKLRRKYQPYLDTLVIGMEKYLDSTREPPGYQAYPSQFEKADRYYDDNGLVAIDYLNAYVNTKDPLLLERAKKTFAFICSGWTDSLDGGVTWLEGHADQKPACSNGMATLAALKLYEATGDAEYLDWGKRYYEWMYTHLRDTDAVYFNSLRANGTIDSVKWSYNSGSMLEASMLLYQFSKEPRYLNEARAIAKGSFNWFSNPSGSTEIPLRIDLPWFITVLYRGYESLYRVDKDPKYIQAMLQSVDYAWQNAKDENGFFSRNWVVSKTEPQKPKWLLDNACIAELYARISRLDASFFTASKSNRTE